ncbi:CopG family transcriptional regulator [Geothermobacter hydrogeniphilus]|uniref:CopG family transcriptional regulator n=1 Tax=Geothermobacter hydrogeniphilus TaxID=1969733 RepID=A0A1X0XXI1_9BACT|nr:CopG family transcriptional regulator [Geothermobacter hydrogeniphilus]ORJ57566.1 CopG family transcriptional regulator [Geothermobacter hydrogeniphilus]
MNSSSRRSTIYFDSEIHKAIKLKAAVTNKSLSELVNLAVRQMLKEDREDLTAFNDRVAEPTISYEQLLDELKSDGKI